MGYVLKAVLSSAQHPEYGQITVPFPIPDEKYDRMIELLEPLEIGDALRQDCRVDELDSFYTVLNRLVGSLVNFDELDYLAKRLDSFDDGEAAQFQGMACKLGVSNIKDFINLTFCCQQATVITDFSDLDAIGRQHYMTMQGGGCRIEELERLDGRKFALDLILNHLEGRITPYGVVYSVKTYCRQEISRGDIYYADLRPVIGSEQGGIRPVLILQNNVGNRHSPTVIAAPITSKMGKPRLPTHVCLNRQANGLSCGSVILLEQLRTIDKSRLRERVGALDTSEMKQIDWALGVSVGLVEGYR